MLELNNRNLALFEKDINLEELPKTFQDAINSTQRKSVEYICSKEDRSREALLMEQIYAGAYCNIAATAGSSARSGCFVDRNIEDVCPIAFQIPLSQDQALTKSPPKMLYHTPLQHPQESYLKNFLGHGPLLDPGTYICHDLDLWKKDITESTLAGGAWGFPGAFASQESFTLCLRPNLFRMSFISSREV